MIKTLIRIEGKAFYVAYAYDEGIPVINWVCSTPNGFNRVGELSDETLARIELTIRTLED